ncbi:DUF4861 domain-containing protein [Thermosulfuriphilus ammonigenes]|uniref:DUF4861 domain-containing protein n=1 Tax=Thermosulfuriphilus ammonigenes TaxID=1936021 RepID=A0A6G7PYL3_9BACT|nr:DUF4861 domain-containing protein [Thermosulfuriphilus ammonigenes]MBA2849844.1 hypothetical protein [Thermosulfuriphilus ammonigenes]QIJ72611.1 DUF4861 domain-containing protein [Thermosulfuriphilus ammonigenes]
MPPGSLIFLEEPLGLKRLGEPVSVGVPWPRGFVREPEELALVDEKGQAVPCQVTPLVRWPDRSIKWALVDFLATLPPKGKTTYSIIQGPPSKPPVSLSTHKGPAGLEINTGAAVFRLSLEDVLPEVVILPEKAPQMRLLWRLKGSRGQEVPFKREKATFEVSGPLRATLLVRGTFRCRRQGLDLRFRQRLSFFAGLSMVRVEVELLNPRRARHRGGYWDLGDPGSMFIRDFSFLLKTPIREAWIQPDSHTEPLYLHPPQMTLYQDSSGGDNWQSRNHVNRHGKIPLKFKGFQLKTPGKISQGLRATPFLRVAGLGAQVSLGMTHFWQNFPKALRCQESGFSLGLFPEEHADLHELQGGERKTHVFWLAFSPAGVAPPSLLWLAAPLVPCLDSTWVERSGALNFFLPEKEDPHRLYHHLLQEAIEGPQSFFVKREVIDEYGWRHFGDLYADHENAFNQASTPLISHYNNQYDVIYGGLFRFLRSGDRRWFHLADELARHVYDIDIYHTDEDKPAYNHGLFWHTYHYVDAYRATHRCYSRDAGVTGGGPSNEHLYSSGLLLHHLLTGDPRSREAVIELAEHVIDMDRPYKLLTWIDRSPSGLASQTRDPWYHGPGRGAGNSINCLLEAFRLTQRRKYIQKAEELIRRCIHPEDDIQARGLDQPEERWSYLVFLQVLGRYLFLKMEWQDLDEMFAYGRAALLHYARWMAQHEYYYLDRPELLEYPTETWAAQEIRKAEVFNLAAFFASSEEERRLFREKSEYFFDRSLKGLLTFKTRHYTRPLAIILSTGYSQAWFKKNPSPEPPLPEPHQTSFGPPVEFVPQKIRALKKIKRLSLATLILTGIGLILWSVS